MKNKWYILLFIVLIAISLFAFQYVAELLSEAPPELKFGTQYLSNDLLAFLWGLLTFSSLLLSIRGWTTLTIQ